MSIQLENKYILSQNSPNTINVIHKDQDKSCTAVNLENKQFSKKSLYIEMINDQNTQASVIKSNNFNKENKKNKQIQTKVIKIKNKDSQKQVQHQDQQSSSQILKNFICKKKAEQQIKNILEYFPKEENYIKIIKQKVPLGKTLISLVNQQRNCFSLQVRLMIKNQQMLKFEQADNILQPTFNIISQGKYQTHQVCFMKCDFLRSIFNVYQYDNNKQERLVATISYSSEFTLKNNPRHVEMYILKTIKSYSQDIDGKKTINEHNLKRLYPSDQGDNITKFVNVEPFLDHNNQYNLNFNENEQIMPSIKNMILVDYETNKQALKLYKVEKDMFKLKVKDNLSASLAYCFVVSSLMFKWTCQ